MSEVQHQHHGDAEGVVRARPITDADFDVHNGYVPHDFSLEGTHDLLHDFIETFKDNKEAMQALDEIIVYGVQTVGGQLALSGEEMHKVTQARRDAKKHWQSTLVTAA